MADVMDISCARTSAFCELDRKDALRFMKQNGPMDEELAIRFERIARDCEERFPVHACWRTFAVAPDDGSGESITLVGSPLVLTGHNIARYLAGATHVVLMAFTLGMDQEREAMKVDAINTLDALIFDACASSLVDSGADVFQARIVDQLHDAGYAACNNRYSPGYGDLPLDIQPAFLDTIDAGKKLGIYTTNENFLKPVKSITAILGVKPLDDQKGADR